MDRVVHDSLASDDVRVPVNELKLRELLLLVADKLADDRFGGATKANKVMFFAEFAHMRLTGRPITGAAYQKLPQGPAPRRLRPVREQLLREGAATLFTEHVLGRQQHRLVPRRPARRDLFSDLELRVVDEAVALLHGRTAAEASKLSHEEAGWQLVEEGADIPFVTAYLSAAPDKPSARVRERAAQIAEDYARRGA